MDSYFPNQLKYRIGIIAPSRKVTHYEIKETVDFLKKHKFHAVFSERLFNTDNQFAGTDEDRAMDVMEMFTDSEIKVILCARGGYGSARLLELLDAKAIKKNPKLLIGFSDVTALHSYLHTVCGIPSIHATMPICLNSKLSETDTWQMLRRLLEGELPNYSCTTLETNRSGKANGVLVGGNLSVLYSLRGTFADIDTDGKILFIEDIDEYLYHIDRMMLNLKLGGKLKNLAGLIVGGMTNMKDNEVPFGKTPYEIIADYVKGYQFPVVYKFPAGHDELNIPMIFGQKMELNVEKANVSINYTETLSKFI